MILQYTPLFFKNQPVGLIFLSKAIDIKLKMMDNNYMKIFLRGNL